MKSSLLVLFMLLLCITTSAQYAQIQNHYSFNKHFKLVSVESDRSSPFQTETRPPGERMKSVGSSLTLGGSALFLIGVVVTATTDFNGLVDDNTSTSSSTTTNNSALTQLYIGVIMAEGGIGMMVPGIIFWNKGAKKLKRYQSEHSLSLRLKGAGLSLRYKL